MNCFSMVLSEELGGGVGLEDVQDGLHLFEVGHEYFENTKYLKLDVTTFVL